MNSRIQSLKESLKSLEDRIQEVKTWGGSTYAIQQYLEQLKQRVEKQIRKELENVDRR